MRIAAITMVKDEPVFLPLWIKHYGKQFGVENLFIIDHASKSIDTCDVRNVIRIPETPLRESQRAMFVSRFHSALLEYYDCAVYTDADEFLVADPARWPDLRTLIARTPNPTISAMGVNVIHDRETEPDLDISKPILAQRQYVQFDPLFCKPAISRKALTWRAGFHAAVDLRKAVHAELYLFHLKTVDWSIAHVMRDLRSQITLSDYDRSIGQSTHFEYSADEFEDAYFGRISPALKGVIPSDFRFRADLKAYVVDANGTDNPPRTIDRIPQRFNDAICGV